MKEEKIVFFALLFLVGCVVGGFFYHFFLSTGGVNPECVADLIEEAMRSAQKDGYVFHSGFVRLENTLGAIINWYFQYDFISRSLLEMQVNQTLRRCKR